MANKFDVCFTMAKEILFIKYPALLELESHHGVDLGPAYHTPDSAKAFTSYIAKSQRQRVIISSETKSPTIRMKMRKIRRMRRW